MTDENSLWSAFLTPQGKFLHEFFMTQAPDGSLSDEEPADILLECERERSLDLAKRLSRYKLRADVALADASDQFLVAAVHGPNALSSMGLTPQAGQTIILKIEDKFAGIAFTDPRLPELGARMHLLRDQADRLLKKVDLPITQRECYDELRISLGVPDGSRDMEIEKSILLENGFEELNGVDFKKGCFMGQELTARTKYRALIKKRLLPVTFQHPPPAPGTRIMANGKDAGTLFSATSKQGLALLRLQYLKDGAELTADGTILTPAPPTWLSI
ncbi:MAG: folate-binding protein [Pseudomonadota bacterium]